MCRNRQIPRSIRYFHLVGRGGLPFMSAPFVLFLWLLLRVSRCDADIVECEHRMTRYAAFAGAYYIFQYVVVILFVAGMLLYAAGYYTAHGMWWTVAALLSLTAVACIVITHHEWGRIRDLQRRIRELREFDEA